MWLAVKSRGGIAGLLLAACACWGQSETPASPSEPVPLIAPDETPTAAIAPFTMNDRFRYAWRRSFAPENFALGMFTSGIQTWRGRPEEWGRDWEGYAQRFGMRMSRSILGNGIDFGVGAALGTDPRYRRLGSGGFGARLKHALGASFYHHDSGGRRVPAVSRFAGIAGSNIISNHWMPPGDNRKIDVLRRSGQQVAWHIGWTVFREFAPDLKRKLRR